MMNEIFDTISTVGGIFLIGIFLIVTEVPLILLMISYGIGILMFVYVMKYIRSHRKDQSR